VHPAQAIAVPLVSVILPFHRVTPFVRPAAESILGQTCRDLELIVVDNGTGRAPEALGPAVRDPRVRLVEQPSNLGVAAAHNAARALAGGEFIANMDSDDLALPSRLERQVEALRADPGLDLLATHARVIDAAGRVLRPQFTLADERDARVFSAYSLPITNPTLMGRRRMFERFPMRSAFPVSSDYDFFARVVEVGRVRALPEALLHYRRHEHQLTVSRYEAMVLNACLIRVITARRRAARPEALDDLLAQFAAWMTEPPRAADCYARFAALALAEGLPLLAVFLARRSVAAERTPGRLTEATRLLARALRQPSAEALPLLRMFATGPIRTHGLKAVE
jgi:glycosyltransferase involved in cell wall biosynthesis